MVKKNIFVSQPATNSDHLTAKTQFNFARIVRQEQRVKRKKCDLKFKKIFAFKKVSPFVSSKSSQIQKGLSTIKVKIEFKLTRKEKK